VKDLPQYGEWEVALVDVPGMSVKNVELAGVLLVVSRDDGMVLGATAVPTTEDLSGTLLGVALEPARPSSSHRPAVLWCYREAMGAFASAAVAFGAQIRAAPSLPDLEEARDALVDRFGGVDVVPRDPKPWVDRVRALVDAAPWRALSDQTMFVVVQGPEAMMGRAAMVLGNAGEQYGIVMYPSLEHVDRMLDALDDEDAGDAFEGWCAHLDAVDELDPDTRKALQAAGLVRGDFALVTFAVERGLARALDDEEHAQLRAVTDGILAAWGDIGADLETLFHAQPDVETELGPISLLVRPGTVLELPDLLEGIRHRLLFDWDDAGETLPRMTVKATKKDAQTLARRLGEVDGIALGEPVGGGEREILVFHRGEPAGRLGTGPDRDELWDEMFADGELELVLAGGGSTRSVVKNSDVVATLHLAVLEDEDDDEPVEDPGPDPARLWPTHIYDQPPATWPKASDTLIAFAWPAPLASMTEPELGELMELLATVWSGAVVREHAPRDPGAEVLDQALATAEPELREWLEELIERKRTWFSQDRRLMMVDRVRVKRGELELKVFWKDVHDLR